MARFTVPWGPEQLSFEIPDDWNVSEMHAPTTGAVSEGDWPDRMSAAMARPVAGKPLAELVRGIGADGTIALLVEDLTRHSPLTEILDLLMRELTHAGARREQIEIVVGGGMHPPDTTGAMEEKLGPAVKDIPVRWNPWHEIDHYTHIGKINGVNAWIDTGVVDSDLRIIVSSVSPHLQAGFGGGGKMFFPGCGEITSIRRLHRCGIAREDQGQLVGQLPEQNEMRCVIDEVTRRIDARHGTTFTIQYLLDDNNLPTQLAAGEPLATHGMLIKQCANASGVLAEEPADILITNAHPRDHDLWQSFKSIPNTCWGARRDGIIICLARCPEGLNGMETLSWPFSPAWTRRLVHWLGPNRICSLLDRIVATLAGDSQWFIRMATQILERNPIYMVSPNLINDGAKFPGIALFTDVESALAAADEALGTKGSRRVAIYPEGGITYPIARRTKG